MVADNQNIGRQEWIYFKNNMQGRFDTTLIEPEASIFC